MTQANVQGVTVMDEAGPGVKVHVGNACNVMYGGPEGGVSFSLLFKSEAKRLRDALDAYLLMRDRVEETNNGR